MKKLILTMFLMMFALLATPVVYAEDLPEIAATSDDGPLPPLIDEAIANDTAQ